MLPVSISLLFTRSVFAEAVLFHDDTAMQGKMLLEKPDFVVIQSGADKIVIPRKFIKGVYSDAEWVRVRREIERQKKREKRQQKKEKAKEHAKEQLKRKLQSQAAQSSGQVIPTSPGWMVARSAVVPGWGQATAGMTSGPYILGATAGSAVLVLTLDGLVQREINRYKDRVAKNLLLALLPGNFGTGERLAFNFLLNNQLGGACGGPAHKNLALTQVALSGLYVAQLSVLAMRFGATLLGGHTEPATPGNGVSWQFAVVPGIASPERGRALHSTLAITYKF